MNSIKYILLLSVIVYFSGCGDKARTVNPDIEYLDQDPLVLIIKHRLDEYSGGLSDHITRTLTYTKLPFETIDLAITTSWNRIPSSVRTIVLTTFKVNELTEDEVGLLTEFVASGNQLVIAGTVTYDNFAHLQGILPFSQYRFNESAAGVHFLTHIFPGSAGLSYTDTTSTGIHKGISRDQFSSKVTVLAGAENDRDYPFLVANKIGLGEVLTINSYAVSDRKYRGVLFSAILRGLQGLPYNVANTGAIFLDDFPSPLYEVKVPAIEGEYDLTHSEFIRKVWWPDLKSLADSFDISYTAMTTFNYNANVVPPFDFDEWLFAEEMVNGNEVKSSPYLANEIHNTRHQLGFHGYNHFSLVEENWRNVNFMASSVLASRKRWRIDRMGDLPTVYVPPSNTIDSSGVNALMKGMPRLRVIASDYLGQIENGGGREFGYEPYSGSESIYNLPRISEGFFISENSLFDQQSLQVYTGIWTHALQPDDVVRIFQPDFQVSNPLELGWKTHPELGYGLYQEFERRLGYTRERYPMLNFHTAQASADISENWNNRLVHYQDSVANVFVKQKYRVNFTSNDTRDDQKFWFSYVSESNIEEYESVLKDQEFEYIKSPMWEGYLLQFSGNVESFSVPDLRKSEMVDYQLVNSEVTKALNLSRIYQTQENKEFIAEKPKEEQPWVDSRLDDALNQINRNPDSYENQERLIALSLEFGQIPRAIGILERRLLASDDWAAKDTERLIQYYGWEGMGERAITFLDLLWDKYESQQVIDLKNYTVSTLFIGGVTFNRKWLEREFNLNNENEDITLRYTRSIETLDNWPVVKSELRRLIGLNPESDSLYNYTIQRSIWYESPDSTIALVEEFPSGSHVQLDEFATNIALFYAYEIGDFPRALYWADRVEDFDRRLKLDWYAHLNLYSQYESTADELIALSPEDDSLRVRLGTQFYYQGFREKGMEVMYPVFEKYPEGNSQAHTLMDQEISYMGYEDRKELYRRYPAFFRAKESERLSREYRIHEGPKLSVYGEFRDDNFDNRFAKLGSSVEVGNRNKGSHTFRLEDLYFETSGTSSNNFMGGGYEFIRRNRIKGIEFHAGGALYVAPGDMLPEVFSSYSYSYDSTFTLGRLSFGPVLTNSAVINNFNKVELQTYRERLWKNDFIVTTFSGVARYYTNEVFSYAGTGRIYLQPVKKPIWIRPIGELSWSDASVIFTSGDPYFTPDKIFTQGIGVDFRLRKPDNFDYLSLFNLEIMGKHQSREGLYGTGRLQVEHQFNNFWEFTLGSELSSSQIYRSNRVFFTLSYYFRKKELFGDQN